MSMATQINPRKTRSGSPRRGRTHARPAARKKDAGKDLSVTYNEFKQFEGKEYTGMTVGRSHKWYYDKGEWKETKITLIFGRFHMP